MAHEIIRKNSEKDMVCLLVIDHYYESTFFAIRNTLDLRLVFRWQPTTWTLWFSLRLTTSGRKQNAASLALARKARADVARAGGTRGKEEKRKGDRPLGRCRSRSASMGWRSPVGSPRVGEWHSAYLGWRSQSRPQPTKFVQAKAPRGPTKRNCVTRNFAR
jgi:hypothetical protein